MQADDASVDDFDVDQEVARELACFTHGDFDEEFEHGSITEDGAEPDISREHSSSGKVQFTRGN